LITQVHLENVLAFRSLEIEMRRLTLLSGTNSAGKSSLLHALALLRQSERARLLPLSLMLNGDLVELGTGRDVLHSEPAELPGISDVAFRVSLSTEEGRKAWLAIYEAGADVLALRDAPEVAEGGGLFSAGFQYLKADRIVPAVVYPKSHEAVTVQEFLGANGEHAPNYLRVHGERAVRCLAAAHREASGTTLLEQTNAWLGVLSAGTFLEVADVENTDFVRLSFQRSGPEVRTETHRATNVGFGLTYALPVIIGCLMASPGCLLLIENPEAHLHPRGQAVLGRLCARAAAGGAQVIVETHSDHVLNAVRLAVKHEEVPADDVVLQFFTRAERVLQPELTTLRIAADGMIPAWPPGFFDEWDRALDQILG
jgi:predicted ATPase